MGLIKDPKAFISIEALESVLGLVMLKYSVPYYFIGLSQKSI